jgi:ubiquinone/menaquinone biosynthesis C-methylase UbiE
MDNNWIVAQTLQGVSQFDQAMMNSYPDSNAYLQNAREYLKTVGDVCNYIAATEQIEWLRYLPQDAKVLDIGCGGGWLAAILSRFDAVSRVYALDSSQHFLHKLMPQVMSLMQGRSEKLIAIEGLFQPLLFEDGHLEVVVASSALHHADNLESVLREIRRTLKRGGLLFVINETPRPGFRHFLSVAMAAFRILRNLLLQRYVAVSPSISSSAYLYDPKLGDRDYPQWHWEKALESSGFSVESVINTGLPTVKGSQGRPLIHFICRAV